ncbi:MAG: rhodanese-like domain-containing protein [Acidimicrobiia bacterium]
MTEFLSADDLLTAARSQIQRFTPTAAREAQASGATIIDLRCGTDREAEGSIPGAIPIALSVLPWRVDPGSDYRDERLTDRDASLILVCNDGYSSSLAAAQLVSMGFVRAADLDGGFRAWAAAGLPLQAR